jgi:hypothetical protein
MIRQCEAVGCRTWPNRAIPDAGRAGHRPAPKRCRLLDPLSRHRFFEIEPKATASKSPQDFGSGHGRFQYDGGLRNQFTAPAPVVTRILSEFDLRQAQTGPILRTSHPLQRAAVWFGARRSDGVTLYFQPQGYTIMQSSTGRQSCAGSKPPAVCWRQIPGKP